ncbi:unnamed protein product [Closterium sp. NIES-64]|nr:unnamed protein product [Closterium sp. NIES-64]
MGGGFLAQKSSRKCSAVASVTSAEVRDEISDSGKGGKVRKRKGSMRRLKCSSGRGGVARNYSVVQGLGTLVLAKVRALSGRAVATHSKTCSSIARGPLSEDSGVSISSRGRDGARATAVTVLTGQGRSGGSVEKAPCYSATRLPGGSAPRRLGCKGGSAAFAARWSGGSACCSLGGSRARGGGAVSAGAAGLEIRDARPRIRAGGRERWGGGGPRTGGGPGALGRRGREIRGGGAVALGLGAVRSGTARAAGAVAAGPAYQGGGGRSAGAAGAA